MPAGSACARAQPFAQRRKSPQRERKILQAIGNRDPAEARSWMDKHIVDFGRGYELANFDIDAPVGWPAARETNSGN